MRLIPDRFSVAGCWLGASLGPTVLERAGDALRVAPVGDDAVADADVPHFAGSILPGMVDSHVHLGLVDAHGFADCAVVEVHDRGWIPEVAAGWRRAPHTNGRIRAAGPLLTPPGGYPHRSGWAPEAAIRDIGGVDDAIAAVVAATAAGFDSVKVVLHADGAQFSVDTLEALITSAHLAGLPVGVHAEGVGQAARAFAVGADCLVHTPWNEPLPDALLASMAAAGMVWVSTLAIHRGRSRACAIDNARRFVATGGQIVYGTDLGNGPQPVGPNPREIRALGRIGLEGNALLVALAGGADAAPLHGVPAHLLPIDRAIFAPGPVPVTAPQAAHWMVRSRRLRFASAAAFG